MMPICSICQSDLLSDELDEYGGDVVIVKVAPCAHVYHRHCVQLLHDYHEEKSRNRERLPCPICRQPIVTAEGELQWEPVFLSADDESASQRRQSSKARGEISTKAKSILSLAKELKEQSRDALVIERTVKEQDSLRKSCREGVFQQLADWTEKLKARLGAIEEVGAAQLLTDNLQEWQMVSAAIIEACEQTRKLPDLIETYKSRVSALQAKAREHEAEMANQAREHRRQKVDSAAKFRQKGADLAQEYKDKESRLRAELERDVQIWRTKYQTAQENGNNAVTELHLQKARTESLTEQLDAAKNEENLIKGRLQKLQHKLAKKAEECVQAQRRNEEYEREIARLQAENKTSERRMREMSEHQSSRRSHRFEDSDDRHRCYDPSSEAQSSDAYLEDNEESLAVDPPVFETPSRKRRDVHPTLRVFRPGDLKQPGKQSEDSNIIAFASDEEEGYVEQPNKRPKINQGHARNPFATTSRENDDAYGAYTHQTAANNQPRQGLTAKSRLLQPLKTPVIVLDPSSDPPEADPNEVELIAGPPRNGVSGGKQQNKKERLIGGKRHEIIPEMFKKPTVVQKAAAVLGNRASGPKHGRRAV